MTRIARPLSTITLAMTLLLALLTPVLGAAGTRSDKATFDIYLRGIKAAALGISGVDNGQSYAAAGKLESTGLLGLFVDVRYDASAKGRIGRSGFVPSTYTEKTSGVRNNTAVMNYKGGVPQVKVYDPPRSPGEDGVDPATQAGALDPMTAIYGALRDVPRAEVCDYDVRMFDGKRASRVSLSQPRQQGDGFTCSGLYQRVKGWSAEELAEKSRFPFTLTYQKVGADLFRVTRIELDTTFGRAKMIRR
jgi:hypothetical protein